MSLAPERGSCPAPPSAAGAPKGSSSRGGALAQKDDAGRITQALVPQGEGFREIRTNEHLAALAGWLEVVGKLALLALADDGQRERLREGRARGRLPEIAPSPREAHRPRERLVARGGASGQGAAPLLLSQREASVDPRAVARFAENLDLPRGSELWGGRDQSFAGSHGIAPATCLQPEPVTQGKDPPSATLQRSPRPARQSDSAEGGAATTAGTAGNGATTRRAPPRAASIESGIVTRTATFRGERTEKRTVGLACARSRSAATKRSVRVRRRPALRRRQHGSSLWPRGRLGCILQLLKC